MLLTVTIPHEPFNTLVREKKAGTIIGRILAALQPEAVSCTEENGTRGAVLVIDVAEPSRVPSFAEPFLLNFNADCRFRIVMSPEDLGRAGLDALGEHWGEKIRQRARCGERGSTVGRKPAASPQHPCRPRHLGGRAAGRSRSHATSNYGVQATASSRA